MQNQVFFIMKASKPVTQKLFKGLPDSAPRSSCFQRSHLPPSTKDLDFSEMKVVPSLCRTNTSTGNVHSFSTIPVPLGSTSLKPGATPAHACPAQTLSPPLSYNWQSLRGFSKVEFCTRTWDSPHVTSTSKDLVLPLLGTNHSLEFEKFSLPHSFLGLFTFVCNWGRIKNQGSWSHPAPNFLPSKIFLSDS